mgnify:FL=1
MVVWTNEQAKIDNLIKEQNISELDKIKEDALSELEGMDSMNKMYSKAGMQDKITSKKEAHIIIEIIVRIEAFQNKKGWWFRAKRRKELIMKYT